MPDEPINRPQIFSEEFVSIFGEEFVNKLIDQLCQGLTEVVPEQRPTSLCLEIAVFEMDEDILRSLVRCTFAQINPVLLTQDIISGLRHVNYILNGRYNNPQNNHDNNQNHNNGNNNTLPNLPANTEFAEPFPNTEHSDEEHHDNLDFTIPKPEDTAPIETDLPMCKFEILQAVMKKLTILQEVLLDTCHIQDALFEEILLHPTQLAPDEVSDSAVIDHMVIQRFRETLIAQHDNFALKLCNKVSCINSDIEFMADQIKQVTINFPAGEQGIIEIADAAGSVAEAFYSEEDDFAEIFDAVDEVAELIEDIAEFYKVKLKQLQKLLSLSIAGCPVPIEARATLPTIPETPPPPTIFPVIGLPGSATTVTPSPFITP